jgi:proline iminopeptidase
MRLRQFVLCVAATLLSVAPAVGQTGMADGPHDVVVDSVRLWYGVGGTARDGTPPVVFLHGGPGQGSVHFQALAGPAMERRLRMVYLDQRGSGRSERPWNGAYSMDALVRDVEGVRRALGAEKIALIGHSFGGALALEYAAAHPEHVASVVLVAPLFDAPLQMRLRCESMMRVFAAAARRAVPDPAARAADADCDWFWKLPDDERGAMNNALMFPDSAVRIRLDSAQAASGQRNTGELSSALFRTGLLKYRFDVTNRVTMPVLIAAGRQDRAVVVDGLRQLAARLPNARLVELENSGHFVYLDETERFATVVASFIASGGRR